MSASQPTIIATSIGFRAEGPDRFDLTAGPVYWYAADLARAGPRPRLCFIGTAAGDNPFWYTFIQQALAKHDMVVSRLSLFPMPNFQDAEAHLLEQDVVWVDGGSTANLLALWRLHGLDRHLHTAWQAGVVLGGVSAGSVCWHVGGTTDSFRLPLQPVTDALGWLPYSNSPHHDAEAERRPLIHQLVADGTLPTGYATDNGAGLVYYGTELHEVIAETDGPVGYEIRREGDRAVETPLPTRVL
jgi:peptidase E